MGMRLRSSGELGPELVELVRRLEASEGVRLQRAWIPVGVMYRAFRGNGEELLRLLFRQRSSKLVRVFWEPEGERPERALLFETARLLLNYLASAIALLAHQRNLVRREYPTGTSM